MIHRSDRDVFKTYNDTNILAKNVLIWKLVNKNHEMPCMMKSSEIIKMDIYKRELFYTVVFFSAEHLFPNFN